ncbi:Beta-lactamase-like protein 2 [Daldinia childiae]|uniref:Beta-lactamase-like protein 2 n=1 Tax=Daldinia childiae TaxID=326645 RepID=UPI0014483071|nr:Beta-lactamase-like protein 2 [Daldinia childiae]KAF3058614.1 Beta-lactamase-like protein 2 [Daldinia childiae]
MALGTLYIHHPSARTPAILAIAKEYGIELEIVHADTHGGENYDKLIKFNSLAQIPVFVGPDGFVLTECIPIALYITGQSDTTTLLGSNRREYYQIIQWMSMINSEMVPNIGGVVLPLLGRQPSVRQNSEDCLRRFHIGCKRLDTHLQKNRYLVGDQTEKKKGVGGYRQINKSLNICAFDSYLNSQQATLPELADVEQISPRVIRVLGQNPGKFTLQGTNTWIIGTGEKRLIIDTGQGIPAWADLIESTLSDMGFSFSHVLLTHWHGDHTQGVPDLLRLYPYLHDSIYKNSPGKGQQPISDGQIFKVEGATKRMRCSPAIMSSGMGVARSRELGTYMATLDKMRSHGCITGYPAHGVVIENLQTRITGELAQKLRREIQVLKVLNELKCQTIEGRRGGVATLSVMEIVVMIHGDALDEEVAKLALEPFIEEVLRKLTDDGKVAFQIKGGRQKRWFSIE